MGRPVLELEQLRLRYPGSNSWTLDGLNLSLEPGETLALVGSSGCGKSTVARAVMQLLPQGTICEGRLALTGQDPRQLRRPQLRQLRGEAGALQVSSNVRVGLQQNAGGLIGLDEALCHVGIFEHRA